MQENQGILSLTKGKIIACLPKEHRRQRRLIKILAKFSENAPLFRKRSFP
ncbi:hypothetical protein [Borborobacter arsenicus]|nr:hypothetical protein [Pseudaminobacter arsenicus]